VSYSWVDPHFAALYARREEERLAERLVTRLRERSAREPFSSCHARSKSAGADFDRAKTPEVSLRSGDVLRGHLRLL
jgi:hypothetical protein